MRKKLLVSAAIAAAGLALYFIPVYHHPAQISVCYAAVPGYGGSCQGSYYFSPILEWTNSQDRGSFGAAYWTPGFHLTQAGILVSNNGPSTYGVFVSGWNPTGSYVPIWEVGV